MTTEIVLCLVSGVVMLMPRIVLKPCFCVNGAVTGWSNGLVGCAALPLAHQPITVRAVAALAYGGPFVIYYTTNLRLSQEVIPVAGAIG